MVDVWVIACLFPFFVLLCMIELGKYIYRFKLAGVLFLGGYMVALAYIHNTMNVNPFMQVDFWICSFFMAFVLYVGWCLGKNDHLKVCQKN
jgi:hypothetical protein